MSIISRVNGLFNAQTPYFAMRNLVLLSVW